MSSRTDSRSLTPNLTLLDRLSAFVRHASRNGVARFCGHFFEMVLAMFPGMIIFHAVVVFLSPGNAFPPSSLLYQVLMALSMAVPMAGWMLFRGHTCRQAIEMSTAMLLPMAVLAALSMRGFAAAGMILGMLGLMLYRRDEYVHGWCHEPETELVGSAQLEAGNGR